MIWQSAERSRFSAVCVCVRGECSGLTLSLLILCRLSQKEDADSDVHLKKRWGVKLFFKAFFLQRARRHVVSRDPTRPQCCRWWRNMAIEISCRWWHQAARDSV